MMRRAVKRPAIDAHRAIIIGTRDAVTASLLLLVIGAALLLQLAAGAGIAVWRHRRATAARPLDGGLLPTPDPPGAWRGLRDFRVARRAYEDVARTQCSFSLEPVDGAPLAAYKPGQFLTVVLPVAGGEGDAPGDTRNVTRCYSLSDRDDASHFRITVKRALAPADRPSLPAGLASTHLHDHVHEGDVIRVKAPSGHFVLDPDPTIPAVLIGGGIGITPLMSMLSWSLAEQPEREVHLFYGVRCGADHAFKVRLEELAALHATFHLHVVYLAPDAGDVEGRDYQHTGFVDIALLGRTLPEARQKFYVCGPPVMMTTLVPALERWRVPAEDLHFEAFGPATVPPPSVARAALLTPFDVQFQRSGRTLEWNGTDATLLDLAERHGVEIDSGCRAGSCGSCETRLLAGTVHYAHTPDYEMQPGHCLVCVGTPESDLVLDA